MKKHKTIWSKKTVGERVHAARAAMGLSLRVLGKRTKLSAVYISYIERGTRNPPLKTIRKLADALGVPVAWLIPE